MAAYGVAHLLDKRLHVLVEGLGVEARVGIALPHQRARGGDIERTLQSLVKSARLKALEVCALAAGDVDDLNIFAGAYHIGLGCCLANADILEGIG